MFAGKARILPKSGANSEWVRLAKDKRSSILWKFVYYGRKKFFNIGPMMKNSGKDMHSSLSDDEEKHVYNYCHLDVLNPDSIFVSMGLAQS